MMKNGLKLGIVCCTLAFATIARAASELPQAPPPPEQLTASEPAPYRFTVNFASVFIALGAFWPVAEYMVDGRHGLIAEGAYYLFGPSAGDYEGALGYRRYLSGRGQGGFLGAFARAGKQGGTLESGKYSYYTKFAVLGANVGYKWQLSNGWCFTSRIGWGYPFTDVEWTPARPDDWRGPLIEALMGADAELSVGYSF